MSYKFEEYYIEVKIYFNGIIMYNSSMYELFVGKQD